jgi:hypothetical protein
MFHFLLEFLTLYFRVSLFWVSLMNIADIQTQKNRRVQFLLFSLLDFSFNYWLTAPNTFLSKLLA